MSTIETVSAETTKVVESMTYLESIDYLSSLEFENDTLFNEETLPLNVSIATTTVAAIFRKSESDVISDLTDQRQQEIKDVNDNNDFRYGHNSQPDE